MMIKILKFTVFVICISLLVLILSLFFYRQLSPLAQINHPFGEIESQVHWKKEFKTQSGEERIVSEIGIYNSEETAIITISQPVSQSTPLPVLFVIGGLNHGETYLKLLERHGDNSIVGFHYPNNEPEWEDNVTFMKLFDIRKSMLQVPHHFALSVKWLTQQAFVDTTKISFMSYSMGALFAPSSLHVAQHHNLKFNTISIVYGSAFLSDLIGHNLKLKNSILNHSASWILESTLYPLEPSEHIPHISGSIHIINGTLDKKIPIQLAEKTHALYPSSAYVEKIPEKHMHPKRKELTRKLVNMSLDWLYKKDAINQ